MIALALDASTYTGTVAVLRDGKVVVAGEAAMRGEREERLMPAVADVLRAAGVAAGDVNVVVCGAGPGSFTSLRIAASIAKGFAFPRLLPLRAVSSLLLTVAAAELEPCTYLSVLDALRGEMYAQLVSVTSAGVSAMDAPRILAADAVAQAAREHGARIIGPNAELAASPHARGVARLVGGVEAAPPVDAAAWEPDYGRLAEAQVRWESAHGRPLSAAAFEHEAGGSG